MNIYYYRIRGTAVPFSIEAETIQEARKLFREWERVKRLRGEVWKK